MRTVSCKVLIMAFSVFEFSKDLLWRTYGTWYSGWTEATV